MSRIEALNIAVSRLHPNPKNPNRMSDREFDMLVENIQRDGFTETIYCRPLDWDVADAVFSQPENEWPGLIEELDLQFQTVSGHHRVKAAQYLEITELKCLVRLGEDFTEEEEDMQLVRHNMISGKLDPAKFFDLVAPYLNEYGPELTQEMMGFADEAEFKRLIEQTAEALPTKELQEKFKESAAELKTIDDLSKLLNSMFTKYGDTLKYGYMVVDYGGKKSYWLRVGKKTYDAMDVIADICIDNETTMDAVIGMLIQSLAGGELPETMEQILSNAPKVVMPKPMPTKPTQDNVEALNAAAS